MEPVLNHLILISFVNIKENVKFPVFLHCWCFRNNDTFLFKVDIFKSGLTHLPWKEQPGSTEMLLISPRPKQHGPVSWCRSIKQVCKLILSQVILGFRGWLLFFFYNFLSYFMNGSLPPLPWTFLPMSNLVLLFTKMLL